MSACSPRSATEYIHVLARSACSWVTNGGIALVWQVLKLCKGITMQAVWGKPSLHYFVSSFLIGFFQSHASCVSSAVLSAVRYILDTRPSQCFTRLCSTAHLLYLVVKLCGSAFNSTTNHSCSRLTCASRWLLTAECDLAR
jgi:hypothetical protein